MSRAVLGQRPVERSLTTWIRVDPCNRRIAVGNFWWLPLTIRHLPCQAGPEIEMWELLDSPLLWESSRIALDVAFGLYRKRIGVMQAWGLLEGSPSVLDIGCGTGQYARITEGTYLGVDMNERYIRYAVRRYRRPGRDFRCIDVTHLCEEHRSFALVLLVDFLHHLSDEECGSVLGAASRLAERHVVSFEPITHQPHFVGRWIVQHDRGRYVRSLEDLHALFRTAGLATVRSRSLRLGPINTQAILCRP